MILYLKYKILVLHILYILILIKLIVYPLKKTQITFLNLEKKSIIFAKCFNFTNLFLFYFVKRIIKVK